MSKTAASTYYCLSPAAQVQPTDDGCVITTPKGKTIHLSRAGAKLLRALRSRSLEFLQRQASSLGCEDALTSLIAEGAFVRTSVTDDFRTGAFAAFVRHPAASTLVVQFRGGHYDVIDGVPPREFARATQIDAHHLLMLRDIRGRHYLEGLSSSVRDADQLGAWLDGFRYALSAGLYLTVGTSMGAYAAIMFGMRLRAKEVWAFAPSEPEKGPRLADELSAADGDTRYTIFYGDGNEDDKRVATSLAHLPNVELVAFPTSSHLIVPALMRAGKLPTLACPPPREREPQDIRERLMNAVRENATSDIQITEHTELRRVLDSFGFAVILSLLSDLLGAEVTNRSVANPTLKSVNAIVAWVKANQNDRG